jgi:hypothetical protein
MWKLGLWPRNLFSGKICFEFSALVLCSDTSISPDVVSFRQKCGEKSVFQHSLADSFLSKFHLKMFLYKQTSQGADPHPPSSILGKEGRNHLNEEITSFLPTGIGEEYGQTISNLGHTALLRRFVLPL